VVEDLAAELVAVHERIAARGHDVAGAHLAQQLLHVIGGVTHAQVRAADPAALHAHEHLAPAGPRLGKVLDPQCGVLAHDGFHRAASGAASGVVSISGFSFRCRADRSRRPIAARSSAPVTGILGRKRMVQVSSVPPAACRGAVVA